MPSRPSASCQFGFIDAHWMFDDGGMTPLLCHVLTMSKAFEQCRLRVFYADMNEEDEVRVCVEMCWNVNSHKTYSSVSWSV